MTPWLIAGAVLVPVALLALALRPARYTLTRRAYWRWLLRPWRLATFAPALVGIILIAPYTGDPYWDAVDASVMATATFLTAPWAVGVFTRGRRHPADEYAIALILLLFSASWSYDGWLLFRDGVVPRTSSENLVASTCLYLFGGLLWALEGHGRRPTWGPRRPDWPGGDAGSFRALWPLAAALMLFIALLMISSAVGWV
ncbi:MAG: hypothetical protein H6706_03380 [Myxococcales bacterium]|nr:hypothetical protein [Myxococcales bacterium]